LETKSRNFRTSKFHDFITNDGTSALPTWSPPASQAFDIAAFPHFRMACAVRWRRVSTSGGGDEILKS